MSSGLEKPLATGANSTCRVGAGCDGVVEPLLQPTQASAAHKHRTVPIRNLAERFSCIVPPQPGLSIVPKGMTLGRVILRDDSSTSLGRSASKGVLWQNRSWIMEEYDKQDHSRTRARGKNP